MKSALHPFTLKADRLQGPLFRNIPDLGVCLESVYRRRVEQVRDELALCFGSYAVPTMVREQGNADHERRRAREPPPVHPPGGRSARLNGQVGLVLTDQPIFLPATFKFGNPVHPEAKRLVLTGCGGVPHEPQEFSQFGFLDRTQRHDITHTDSLACRGWARSEGAVTRSGRWYGQTCSGEADD
jgi:hypothetical protein